jgi:two-component system LytT family response regulator
LTDFRFPEGIPATPRGVLRCDDLVFLTDDLGTWIVHLRDISALEARGCETLVRFRTNQVVIRRTLDYCESRLDESLFFRAHRGCIVNMGHLSRPRLKNGCLVFAISDGREIAFSRRRTSIFRSTRRL